MTGFSYFIVLFIFLKYLAQCVTVHSVELQKLAQSSSPGGELWATFWCATNVRYDSYYHYYYF